MCNEHPGKRIERMLKSMGLSRKELATRTGVTEKHINTLISGERNITISFAKKLGYVFGDGSLDPKNSAIYWQNLQNEYDISVLQEQEKNNITNEEITILNNLDEVVDYLTSKKFISCGLNNIDKILQIRNLLKISDLTLIPQISYKGAFRTQLANNIKIDKFVLFAWQAICELETQKTSTNFKLNIDLLRAKLEDIKSLMFDGLNTGIQKLQTILAHCGIAFNVVKHFRGAPVQGFIKQTDDDKLILCLTIRGGRADTFWFTLFHEIAHIFNGDYKSRFVDFDTSDSEIEFRADRWAQDFLIPPEMYKTFIGLKQKITWQAIESFADEVNVRPYIVLGRLQNDGILDWSDFAQYVQRYKWIK